MLQLLEFPVVFLVFMGLGFLVGGLLGVQVLGVIMMPVLFRGVFDITMRAWAHFCWFGLCSVDFLVGVGSVLPFMQGSRDERWWPAFPSPRAWCALVAYRRLVESSVFVAMWMWPSA